MDLIFRRLVLLLVLGSGGKLIVSGLNTTKPLVVTVVNNCTFNVWPGVQPSSGYKVFVAGGFSLKPGQNKSFQVDTEWQGHIWGRTGCRFNQSGKGSCLTGDCNGLKQCNGSVGRNPKTIADLSLNVNPNQTSTYTVSLVQGFNLPMTIIPHEGHGQCGEALCRSSMLASPTCPHIMQVTDSTKQVIACKSPCQAFRTDMHCCTHTYNSSEACRPTQYTTLFKQACRYAFTYPYDSPSLVHKCAEPKELKLIFCH